MVTIFLRKTIFLHSGPLRYSVMLTDCTVLNIHKKWGQQGITLSRWPMFHVCLLMSSGRGNKVLNSEFKHSPSSLLQLLQEFPCVLSVMVVFAALALSLTMWVVLASKYIFLKYTNEEKMMCWLVVSLKPSQWNLNRSSWNTKYFRSPMADSWVSETSDKETKHENVCRRNSFWTFAEETVKHCKYRDPCLHLL